MNIPNNLSYRKVKGLIYVNTVNHDNWLELRHHFIGGSDSPTIVGVNPYSSQYKLWAEKTDRIAGFEGNIATKVGTYLEDFVAKMFAEETGKKIRNCNESIINEKYPFAIANVDRLIVGEDAGLEIKTTSEMNLSKFKNGEYPANYYVQCMHYMAITGRAKWYLAVLVGNREFKTFEIMRNEDEINALMKAEEEFWSLVQNDTPPAVDGSKSTGETLFALHPVSNGSKKSCAPVDDLVAQYLQLKAQIKDLQGIQDTLENQLKEFMGDDESASSGKYSITWKSAERRTVDTKKFQQDTGTDLSAYTKVSTYRTFKAGENKK